MKWLIFLAFLEATGLMVRLSHKQITVVGREMESLAFIVTMAKIIRML